MINLRINNELLSGLVGRALANIIQKKLGVNVTLKLNNADVAVEGATTRIHFDATALAPTCEVENLIKKNMF